MSFPHFMSSSYLQLFITTTIPLLQCTGLLYYTLGNLHPILRSTLKSIHLLGIAKYEVICKYGIDKLLKPVIDDVLKLEQVSILKCNV